VCSMMFVVRKKTCLAILQNMAWAINEALGNEILLPTRVKLL
jgi:hypothetical protein